MRTPFAPWLQVQCGGVLLGLAFISPWGWVLAWPALWLILRGIAGRSAWERAGDGSLAGVWWGLIALGPWLGEAIRVHLGVSSFVSMLFTFAVVLVYGGAHVAVFATVYGWLPRPRWLSAPAAWVLLEQARTAALGGVPWALLGHSQHGWLRVAQLAELGGVASLSFLIVLTATAFAGEARERRAGGAVAVVTLLATLGFGSLRVATWREAPAAGASVQLVSGGHRSGDRLTTYVTVTRELPAADLTVWPAGALGDEYLQDASPAYDALIATAARVGPLLVGGSRYEGAGHRRHFESAILIVPPFGLGGIYDKQRLVPFAEQAPVPALPLVARATSVGAPDQGPLEVGALHAGVLLGWEPILPALARAYARQGVHVLINLAADEGLGRGVEQQRAFSVFRAIETRRWLLRASGTGVSTAVDPAGRVHRLERVRLPATPPPPTVWVRRGSLMPWLSALVLLLMLVSVAARRWRRPR